VIAPAEIPSASNPLLRHALETYASETNKTAAVFLQFEPREFSFRPHRRSATVVEIFRHQLLSERRFFSEFLGSSEPVPADTLPAEATTEPAAEAFANRLLDLARPRLAYLAAQTDGWWLETRPFFDVERQRIWIFWRRVLHSAHHRTQLSVYLRLLDKPVISIYGPTADVSWQGADPTL
jgi:uncharacterized damage-inducible protein DinB